MGKNDWVWDVRLRGIIIIVVIFLFGPGLAYGIWRLLGYSDPQENYAIVFGLLLFGYAVGFLISWKILKFLDNIGLE